VFGLFKEAAQLAAFYLLCSALATHFIGVDYWIVLTYKHRFPPPFFGFFLLTQIGSKKT